MVRARLRCECDAPERSPEAGRPAAPGWGQLINIETGLAAATNCLGLCRSWCAVCLPAAPAPWGHLLLQAKGSDLEEVKVLPHLCIRSGDCHEEQTRTRATSEWREMPSPVGLQTPSHTAFVTPSSNGETGAPWGSLWAQHVWAAP